MVIFSKSTLSKVCSEDMMVSICEISSCSSLILYLLGFFQINIEIKDVKKVNRAEHQIHVDKFYNFIYSVFTRQLSLLKDITEIIYKCHNKDKHNMAGCLTKATDKNINNMMCGYKVN